MKKPGKRAAARASRPSQKGRHHLGASPVAQGLLWHGRALYLAAYDVADSKRLTKALKICKQYATGGQKSVFECWLSAAERGHMLTAMRRILNASEDRFFLLRLDPRSRVHALGLALPPANPRFFYHG